MSVCCAVSTSAPADLASEVSLATSSVVVSNGHTEETTTDTDRSVRGQVDVGQRSGVGQRSSPYSLTSWRIITVAKLFLQPFVVTVFLQEQCWILIK